MSYYPPPSNYIEVATARQIFSPRKVSYNVSKSGLRNFIIGTLTSVYLFCETLQASNLIKKYDHDPVNIKNYTYNLLFIWLISYALITLANFDINVKLSKCTMFGYFGFAHLGGLGFALLGEIPGLNLVLTKDFWKHLTTADILAFVIIGIPIVYVMVREIIDAIKRREITIQFCQINAILCAYAGLLIMFLVSDAHNLHYHVHHAICSGLLSLWFVEWDRKIIMWVHGLMMGVVVEGLNFYGIGELFLFLSSGSNPLTLTFTFVIAMCFFLIFLIYFWINWTLADVLVE